MIERVYGRVSPLEVLLVGNVDEPVDQVEETKWAREEYSRGAVYKRHAVDVAVGAVFSVFCNRHSMCVSILLMRRILNITMRMDIGHQPASRWRCRLKLSFPMRQYSSCLHCGILNSVCVVLSIVRRTPPGDPEQAVDWNTSHTYLWSFPNP